MKQLSQGLVRPFALSLLLLLGIQITHAAPTVPGFKTFFQPNGVQFTGEWRGDEWMTWGKTSAGKVFLRNPLNGYYEYAELVVQDGIGQLELTGLQVGLASQTQVNQLMDMTNQIMADLQAQSWALNAVSDPSVQMASSDSGSLPPSNAVGTEYGNSNPNPPTLVVMIETTDYSFHSSEAVWSNRFFGTGVGSANHYWNEVSGGQFQLAPAAESYGAVNNGVVKTQLPYAHPHPHKDAAKYMLIDALNQINSYVNFAQFDTDGNGFLERNEFQLMFVVAGPESVIDDPAGTQHIGVWAHKTQFGNSEAPSLDGVKVAQEDHGTYARIGERHGSHDATIGVIVHEMGHSIFELPDLYHSDIEKHLGHWDLMATGIWGKNTNEDIGATPTHLGAWEKVRLGWATPTTLSLTSNAQTISLYATSDVSNYNIVKIPTSTDPEEYFLVENRHNSGYDQGMKTVNNSFYGQSNGGLAVWHIKDSSASVFEKVRMERATRSISTTSSGSSETDIVGNLFYQGNKTLFDSNSTPNSNTRTGVVTNISMNSVSTASPVMAANFSLGSNVVCQSFTSSLSTHQSAGRAYTQSSGSWWYTTTTWYAVGSNEQLGTSSYSSVTLYESPAGHFSKSQCTANPNPQPDPQPDPDPQTGECVVHTSTNSAHTSAGRTYACGVYNLYACTTGSAEQIGLNNSYTSSTIYESPTGYFSTTDCTTGNPPPDPDPSSSCTDFYATTSAHVSAGRAQVCSSWYACTVGSAESLGLNNTYTYATVRETSPGYFEKGSCPN